jgi:hypothetical protein
MPPDLHVTTHIHTDGPIPGPHSLLTLTSAAFTAGGVPISTFSANVRELPGATLHPVALADWRTRAEDWLVTRRSSRPPAVAMTAYARWTASLPGAPVFVADTARPDYLFVYWYLQRFAGLWPFAETCLDPDRYAELPDPGVCTLSGCRTRVPELARTS